MSISLDKTFACLPMTKRGSNVLLSSDPKGEKLVYCCYRSVVTRDIENPLGCGIYQEHTQDCTTAKISPSGFYMASADTSGTIRIWDIMGEENILKNEYRPLSGPILDIAWSEDSKRIVVGGDGRETFGSAFLVDTGSSVGSITGHAKAINSIDMKPCRPYRVITASEDCSSGFYEGPPFKFSHSNSDHTKFVQVARYSPDGTTYVTASSDGRIFKYDGKTGQKTGEIGNPAHSGSVMSLAWSPDSSELLSVSADKTAIIWKVADGSLVTEFKFGETVDDQQVGCLWTAKEIITLSLSGAVNYLDRQNPTQPKQILFGHNKNITSLAVSSDRTKIFTGDFTGRIVEWDAETGLGRAVGGPTHTNQINTIVYTKDDQLITIAMDDSIIVSSASGEKHVGRQVATGSCPLSASHGGDITALACAKGIELYRGTEKIANEDTDFDCISIAVSSDGTRVAVGSKDSKIRLYDTSAGTLVLNATADCKGAVTTCAFSPCGTKLATGDSGRNVFIFSVPALEIVQSGWVFHSAKVSSLAWSADGKHIVSGGLDQQLIVWSLEKPRKRLSIKNAHTGSVTAVAWLTDNRVISVGQDAIVRTWDLVFH
eukprot:CFRG3697T1